MLAVDTSTNNQDKISAEQIRIMHGSIPMLLLTNIFVVLALSYGFSDVIPHRSVAICLALLLVMVLVRGGLYLYYKDKFDPKKLRPFALSLIIGSAMAGGLWATVSFLYLPENDHTYQLFLLLSLMAMAAGSAFTFSMYLPSYFAYIPLTLLPISAQFFAMGDKFHTTLGFVSTVYFLVLTAFNIKINKNFKATLALRFENLELIKQLQLQKDEAEKANKAKSTFLAAASHDLRQPLYALSLFTSVLDETIQDHKSKSVIGKINASVNALTSLFDKLLDISQLDAGVIKVTKRDFSISRIFDDLKKVLDPVAQEKGLKIEWPNSTLAVHSEPELLEQILMNYLSNAIKYSTQGLIRVSCSQLEEHVTVSVSDQGIGIDEESLNHIYEEFYQVENKERERKNGLGLGLSIVRRTASLLGHDIEVASVLGKGSQFSISLEVAKNPVVENQSATALQTFEKSDSNKLVLVIDNEEDIRLGLEQVLILWGYLAITATDLNDAKEKLKTANREPDIIISDYRLKDGETGVDAITALHLAYNKKIPALIITGDIESDNLLDINKSNFQLLFKPVISMKLRAFLRNVGA